jgi:hypothetical protein
MAYFSLIDSMLDYDSERTITDYSSSDDEKEPFVFRPITQKIVPVFDKMVTRSQTKAQSQYKRITRSQTVKH